MTFSLEAIGLAPEQIDALLQPLDPRRVRQVQGNSHLEAWDNRRHLLRVFGWGGWALETLELTCILERSVWSEKPDEPFRGRHMVVYRAQTRLIVKDRAGRPLTHFDDGACGDALNQPSYGDAHDLAMKSALSQSMKRCAVNLGDRFGLSLYNNGGTQAVVGKTLGNVADADHEPSDDVEGGELDGQVFEAADA